VHESSEVYVDVLLLEKEIMKEKKNKEGKSFKLNDSKRIL
jgi:hypothetical protein